MTLRCFDTTNEGVDRDTNGDQEGRCDDVHAGAVEDQPEMQGSSIRGQVDLHSSNHGRGTQQHVGAGEDIVDQTEDHEHNVGDPAWTVRAWPGSSQQRPRGTLTITDADQLQRGMGFGDLSLAGDAQQGKEDNHGTAARGEPEGPSNAIVIAGEGRAE